MCERIARKSLGSVFTLFRYIIPTYIFIIPQLEVDYRQNVCVYVTLVRLRKQIIDLYIQTNLTSVTVYFIVKNRTCLIGSNCYCTCRSLLSLFICSLQLLLIRKPCKTFSQYKRFCCFFLLAGNITVDFLFFTYFAEVHIHVSQPYS